MRLPRLLVLTDRSQLPAGRDLLGTLRACHRAGLRAVIVREHDLDPNRRHDLVVALAGLEDMIVLTSRLPDRAAHGLHLAAHQPVPEAGLWGRSCHRPEDVVAAADNGARWATLSPYAESLSKPGRSALPPQAYAALPVPTYALAGIGTGNAASAIEAGAHGVAVMGAVMRADDPAGVVQDLLAALPRSEGGTR